MLYIGDSLTDKFVLAAAFFFLRILCFPVEQNAKKALSIADRGYVLETGKIVKTGKAADLLNDDAIKKAYLGE